MKNITISLSYYNDFEYLETHLINWKNYNEKVKFQIIDDGSLEKLIDKINLESIRNLDLSIYRINQDIKWNIPGVRNLGATVCETEFVLFCDMDQYFEKEDIYKLCQKANEELEENKFYTFSRKGRERTAGTMLISLSNFWNCGGYDEDLAGNYGYNDPLLRKQLNAINITEYTFEDIFCKQIEADCKLDRSGLNKNKKKMQKKEKLLPRKQLNILNFNWEKCL